MLGIFQFPTEFSKTDEPVFLEIFPVENFNSPYVDVHHHCPLESFRVPAVSVSAGIDFPKEQWSMSLLNFEREFYQDVRLDDKVKIAIAMATADGIISGGTSIQKDPVDVDSSSDHSVQATG